MTQRLPLVLLGIILASAAASAETAELHKQTVAGYRLPNAAATGPVEPAKVVHLAIGLTPRDPAGLRALANAVSDPRSRQFRQFLTLEQLTERFSPTDADYRALIAWAQASKLTVEHKYSHRLLLSVSGQAADVERALAVKLSYAKRKDGTTFYRPDRAPSVDLDVKIASIAGVDNFFVPKRHGDGGSMLNGTAFGSYDVRNAYAGECLGLTGAGQTVGIMALSGYNASDIQGYEQAVGINNSGACAGQSFGPPCLVNNNPVPVNTYYQDEATIDTEMAIAMAPGLSQVEVFEGDGTEAGCSVGDNIFAAWLEATSVKQFSSSVGYCFSDDIATMNMMAAAGQSVFLPSGDDGSSFYYPTTNGFPEFTFNALGNAMATSVGGSVLTMNNAGKSYNTEQAWVFSGGGVEYLPSADYPAGYAQSCTPGCTPDAPYCDTSCIPSWQIGVANPQNGASSTYRNEPDLAMPSYEMYSYLNNYGSYFCGTSASSPLMAGFMALANQQQCINSPSSCTGGAGGLGFIDPVIYPVGMNATTYAASFHDIVGNSPNSTAVCNGGPALALPAVAGYDLATGWGSPKCGLIDQLSCTTCSGKTATPGTPPSTSCVSFQSDNNNCGSCGKVCDAKYRCKAGRCQKSGDVGDTHITTFDGLYYNFQASGEFLVAQSSHDFQVQSRQASGAPRWPLAAVNKAVAVRMGDSRVALCIEPTRLLIDGKPDDLASGMSRSLPGDVRLSRDGDVYLVERKDGESVQATLHDTWIDLAVGLGRSHGKVSGLLGDANGTPANDIVTRDGKALPLPVSFDDMYKIYGDSWRLKPGESMLCEDRNAENGNPARPFYASDLNPKDYEAARATCTAKGVTEKELLDSCILDTAVLQTPLAATVFTFTDRPVVTLKPLKLPQP